MVVDSVLSASTGNCFAASQNTFAVDGDRGCGRLYLVSPSAAVVLGSVANVGVCHGRSAPCLVDHRSLWTSLAWQGTSTATECPTPMALGFALAQDTEIA
mmetsp:Transcript_42825/g.112926  ORF Transcript_42825/g.112926 Transcript_42825/m.112926 type:complete len:100 (-) Transcript_42825:1359-1658(-)